MENHQDNFWQFSDQLRLQGSNFSNLSLNDTIWGSSFGATQKRVEERRNFDIRVGGERSSVEKQSIGGFGAGEVNGFNNGWKIENSFGGLMGGSQHKNITNINGVFNKGVYSKSGAGFNGGINKININNNNNNNNNISNFSNNGKFEQEGKIAGKKYSNNNSSNSSGNNGQNKNSVDKRFKTLPPSESLPRSEPVGGYIFVCNNDTMQENLKRQLFGLPPRYRDSVRQITPGLPLFLYNYSTHQLHGIFEASGFGGSNIDATAWEDKKCPGESRFPAQVKVVTRKICEPLEEDAFRPILHHYDGPKFRLELGVPEALSLLDVFVDNALSDVFVENNS